ncbi:hypothetical protein HDU79_003785 [Rhizoclosmatium sp. JEL0117]|nr:hypothetical protein HDU79_003785 [Rhizoclosmatium sp. JEL0117]
MSFNPQQHTRQVIIDLIEDEDNPSITVIENKVVEDRRELFRKARQLRKAKASKPQDVSANILDVDIPSGTSTDTGKKRKASLIGSTIRLPSNEPHPTGDIATSSTNNTVTARKKRSSKTPTPRPTNLNPNQQTFVVKLIDNEFMKTKAYSEFQLVLKSVGVNLEPSEHEKKDIAIVPVKGESMYMPFMVDKLLKSLEEYKNTLAVFRKTGCLGIGLDPGLTKYGWVVVYIPPFNDGSIVVPTLIAKGILSLFPKGSPRLSVTEQEDKIRSSIETVINTHIPQHQATLPRYYILEEQVYVSDRKARDYEDCRHVFRMCASICRAYGTVAILKSNKVGAFWGHKPAVKASKDDHTAQDRRRNSKKSWVVGKTTEWFTNSLVHNPTNATPKLAEHDWSDALIQQCGRKVVARFPVLPVATSNHTPVKPEDECKHSSLRADWNKNEMARSRYWWQAWKGGGTLDDNQLNSSLFSSVSASGPTSVSCCVRR